MGFWGLTRDFAGKMTDFLGAALQSQFEGFYFSRLVVPLRMPRGHGPTS
jgi:hypothetical protein